MTDFRRCYDEIPDHLAHAITWAKANPDLAVFTYPKETTMTTKQYTAEDFANAEFARHPSGAVAALFDDGDSMPWRVATGRWLSDADMADYGWVPVREAHENDGRVKRLKRHISDVEAVVKRRGEDIERLEAEKAELREQVAQFKAEPITPDALWDAWESAEWANECNEGDILILRYPADPTARVEIWRSGRSGPIDSYTRILHRAPKPRRPEGAERLEALLDEWGDLTRGEEPTPLADWLAERGVRVTEGEGDE